MIQKSNNGFFEVVILLLLIAITVGLYYGGLIVETRLNFLILISVIYIMIRIYKYLLDIVINTYISEILNDSVALEDKKNLVQFVKRIYIYMSPIRFGLLDNFPGLVYKKRVLFCKLGLYNQRFFILLELCQILIIKPLYILIYLILKFKKTIKSLSIIEFVTRRTFALIWGAFILIIIGSVTFNMLILFYLYLFIVVLPIIDKITFVLLGRFIIPYKLNLLFLLSYDAPYISKFFELLWLKVKKYQRQALFDYCINSLNTTEVNLTGINLITISIIRYYYQCLSHTEVISISQCEKNFPYYYYQSFYDESIMEPNIRDLIMNDLFNMKVYICNDRKLTKQQLIILKELCQSAFHLIEQPMKDNDGLQMLIKIPIGINNEQYIYFVQYAIELGLHFTPYKLNLLAHLLLSSHNDIDVFINCQYKVEQYVRFKEFFHRTDQLFKQKIYYLLFIQVKLGNSTAYLEFDKGNYYEPVYNIITLRHYLINVQQQKLLHSWEDEQAILLGLFVTGSKLAHEASSDIMLQVFDELNCFLYGYNDVLDSESGLLREIAFEYMQSYVRQYSKTLKASEFKKDF